ncbi:hypothetical protein MZM54_03390 [[Brevibacterium] frigoritolerans]|nr:hypothetical protein [Peribacillus frigoritolerans]
MNEIMNILTLLDSNTMTAILTRFVAFVGFLGAFVAAAQKVIETSKWFLVNGFRAVWFFEKFMAERKQDHISLFKFLIREMETLARKELDKQK